MTWINVKDRLPPFLVFVEVIYGKKTRMNNLFRGFACIFQGNEEEGIFWVKDEMDERDWGNFGVIYWKEMTPDNRGKTPVLFTTKRNFFGIKLKKV